MIDSHPTLTAQLRKKSGRAASIESDPDSNTPVGQVSSSSGAPGGGAGGAGTGGSGACRTGLPYC